MKIVSTNKENKIVIDKSVFVASIYYVTSKQMVQQILQDLSKQHAKATHITYAYILSSPQEEKAVDDKEPSGSAGLPILNALKQNKLTDVLCIVVRYFGGKKLGLGGLIRAYSQSATAVIKLAGIQDKVDTNTYRLMFSIKDYNLHKTMLNNYQIIDTNFAQDVIVTLKASQIDEILQQYIME